MNTTQKDRLIKLIRIMTRKRASLPLIGEYQSAFRGSGLEFQEVRLYQPGDDIRFIDWNVTARTGQPHIKRFHEERQLSVYFLLDVSSSMTAVDKPESKLKLAADMTSLLSYCAVANKDKAGLVLFSDTIHTHLRPSSSNRQIGMILDSIFSETENVKKTDLKNVLEKFNKILKKRSVIILVTDGWDTSGYDEILKYTAHRHDLICLLINNSLDKSLPLGGVFKLKDPETGKLSYIRAKSAGMKWKDKYLQREKELKDKLKSFGCDVLSVNAGDDYARSLSRFFLKRETKGDRRHG